MDVKIVNNLVEDIENTFGYLCDPTEVSSLFKKAFTDSDQSFIEYYNDNKEFLEYELSRFLGLIPRKYLKYLDTINLDLRFARMYYDLSLL